MKKITLVALFLCVCITLCSCSSIIKKPDKTFNYKDMSITLDSSFKEQNYEGFDVCYESKNMLVCVLRETFTSLKDTALTSSSSVEDYGEAVLSANQLSGSLEEVNGLNCFSYEESVDGDDFTYRAYVFKSDDSFWLIQFAVLSNTYDSLEDDIQKFAETIDFSEEE